TAAHERGTRVARDRQPRVATPGRSAGGAGLEATAMRRATTKTIALCALLLAAAGCTEDEPSIAGTGGSGGDGGSGGAGGGGGTVVSCGELPLPADLEGGRFRGDFTIAG